MEKSKATVKLKRVGPLTRTTVSDEKVDPRLKALDDLLHWAWTWEIQIARMAERMKSEGRGERTLDRRRSFSRVSSDAHLLTVIGLNLATSIKIAHDHFAEIYIDDDAHSALRLLRHIYEHWNRQESTTKRRLWRKHVLRKSLVNGIQMPNLGRSSLRNQRYCLAVL
jgi:hypothetical protein